MIRVREHPLFQRDGTNLICQVPITFSQAALGGTIEVPTLDGTVNHTLKRGMQSGDVVRIPGKGMPNVRGGRPGDLLVQLVVETPRQLNQAPGRAVPRAGRAGPEATFRPSGRAFSTSSAPFSPVPKANARARALSTLGFWGAVRARVRENPRSGERGTPKIKR